MLPSALPSQVFSVVGNSHGIAGVLTPISRISHVVQYSSNLVALWYCIFHTQRQTPFIVGYAFLLHRPQISVVQFLHCHYYFIAFLPYLLRRLFSLAFMVHSVQPGSSIASAPFCLLLASTLLAILVTPFVEVQPIH